MLINRKEMKRKRRDECSSPLLDDSPKRTKVHAQRKFAQGSNVNSPVITPVKEIEKQEIDVMPEPVELLPIKRPNTEDFLTFLCFRGTPILPPSLNFFNTASIVDTNGQVHEIKSESPKNGPIDTSQLTKSGPGSSERPFIAFGVRKRADPIVISRQMDKKRRHALALQALRRKYQEQKMAKIRAVTISKLSEKVTSKTLVRSNSVLKSEKSEIVTKKTSTIHKTKVNIETSKHVKITRSVKAGLRPQINQKMCLRSFRGRFVQRELQFRNVKKRAIPPKKLIRKDLKESEDKEDGSGSGSEYSSEDEEPLSKSPVKMKLDSQPKIVLAKIVKKSAPLPKKTSEISFRITRSNKFINNKVVSRRQQIKQRMLLSTPKTIVKPRTLRSHSTQKCTTLLESKQKILTKTVKKSLETVVKESMKKESTLASKRTVKPEEDKTEPKENWKKDASNVRKDTRSSENKKTLNRSAESVKKDPSPAPTANKNKAEKGVSVKKESENTKEKAPNTKKDSESTKRTKVVVKQTKTLNENHLKKEILSKKKATVILKKDIDKSDTSSKKEQLKRDSEEQNKSEVVKSNAEQKDKVVETRVSQRPTRRTKEAAAIYMEILSHKLVNESKIDDDNVSIDSFPELPNVKKTEQRENELKAKAGCSKNSEGEENKKAAKSKERETDAHEIKVLRSTEKKKTNNQKQNEDNDKHTKTHKHNEGHKNTQKQIDDNDKNTKVSERNAQKHNEHSEKNSNKQMEGRLSEKNAQKQNENTTVNEKTIHKPNETPETSIKTNEKNMQKQNCEKNAQRQDEISDTNTKITNNKKEDEKSKKAEEIKKSSPKPEIKEETTVCDRKTRSANQEKFVTPSLEKAKEIELKVHISPINVDVNSKKGIVKAENREPSTKKKCIEKNSKRESVDLDASNKQSKNKKIEDRNRKSSEEVTKRQTRNSSQIIRLVESDDSDESFHVDVRIPRKKQNTRSQMSKSCESDNEDSLKSVKKSFNRKNYKECSSSDSDHSTTSDVNIKPLKVANKNKKFTKTRGQQKEDQSFSDSDEEPLSKLTVSRNTKSKEIFVGSAEHALTEKKIKVEDETTSKDTKEKTDENAEKEGFKKPKRECAKRPQNYLPMFSSSDEDDYFHGYVKSEAKPKTVKIPPSTTTCSHLPSDLSCQDIGRRFGKGKVNMSTEQIEKWLKDSAMAGSSVKNENDAMLKFGEKIPTETSHSVAKSIDTEKLKSLLITNIDKQDSDVEKRELQAKEVSNEAGSSSAQSSGTKPILGDRKLIFRNKVKSSAVSNANAFSANNENSVYAFGEETEDIMKTPFRRPTRRPSSTATSKSEDESSKFEELPKTGQFRKPLLKQDSLKLQESTNEDTTEEKNVPDETKNSPSAIPSKTDRKQPLPSTSMVPPTMTSQKLSNLKHSSKQTSRALDVSDEFRYKVPSSPSASSSSSAKLYKRQTKFRTTEVMPIKLPDFPGGGLCAQLVEAPTFHPTEKEFQDPLEYLEKIRPKAEQFGICRIAPPSTFKPECKVTDDMRFTAYNQYVHKMLHRWGPNFKELMAIKKYLSTQNISLTHPPWIGGMEVDLPRLYQTVQSLGGLKEVIEKKKWPKVSDVMKIPKSAQDRVTKLDDIYCKYLLPYDTLSPAEREKLFDEVETEWAKRESKSLLKAQQNIDDNATEMELESDDEAEECIVKGRSMALNAFYRIARNTMSMWFKTPEPPAEEVEQEFWKHVNHRQHHICVHSGSIDSGNWGYGFAVSKNSPFARHAWNLKVLTNNSGSVLRSMGPVMGVTVPTLHVGMVFSSCCWYRDPHSLPWIEYLHTGGNKIWYGIPDSASAAFHAAIKAIVPNYCRNKSLWLPSDTVMVPPSILVEHGVSLSRIVQEPGQFIVVFPKVFTSSLSTGYVVSESVYFAPPYWLKSGKVVFDELRNSCEPSMFSFDRLLLSIVTDSRSNVEVLRQIIPAVQELCDKEKSARDKIKVLGVSATEKLPLPEAPQIRKKKKLLNDDGEYECDICRMNLFVSMVTESQENAVFCLEHAAEHIEKKKIQSKHCKLTYTYDDRELEGLVERIQETITNKMQKRVPNKFTGMPTLLGK